MTIIDQINREAKALSTKEQQQALKLLRSLRTQKQAKFATKKTARKTLGKARTALRAVKGIWRDRTDFPSDTVEASIELRRRVMRRGKNG